MNLPQMPDFASEEAGQTVQDPATSLSKRAARRIIQRTFVLMGKDKFLRQQIRELQITTLWIIEDWQLDWSVYLNRGKFEFERRIAKRPDFTLTWGTAEEFFRQAELAGEAPPQVQILPDQERRQFFETLVRGFFASLRGVLAHPVDALGESLL